MRFGTSDHIFNIHDVQLIIKFISLTKIKDITDFPKLAQKLSVIRTDRHEDLVRPKNILPVRKKNPKIHCHVHNV